MGRLGRRESRALLDAAFAAGIRHYDTAPMYGCGEAERCLGDFLKGKRGDVTIATKYGIMPPTRGLWKQNLTNAVRSVARPLVQVAPGLRRKFRVASAVVSPKMGKAKFSGSEARKALEASLLAMRTDHVDLWLLHEAEVSDLDDTSLLGEMKRSRAEGKIGTFGVGSDGRHIPRLYRERPEYCRVMQFEWAITSPRLDYPGSFRLHHGSFNRVLAPLSARLTADKEQGSRWSNEIGADLRNKDTLAKLLLKAALELNPQSIVLFFSSRPSNIEAAVATEADTALTSAALRLWEIMQRESSVAA